MEIQRGPKQEVQRAQRVRDSARPLSYKGVKVRGAFLARTQGPDTQQIKLPDLARSSFAFCLMNHLRATVHTLLFTHAVHTGTLRALPP